MDVVRRGSEHIALQPRNLEEGTSEAGSVRCHNVGELSFPPGLTSRSMTTPLKGPIAKRSRAILVVDAVKNLDSILEGAVSVANDKNIALSHHLPHRVFLGGLFLLSATVSRWLSVPGLATLLGSRGLAYTLTGSSFLTTNLLAVYASNRLPFEGVFDKTQIATGFLALLPSALEGCTAYIALTLIGLSPWLAVPAAMVNGLSGLFYYWEFMERAADFWFGYDYARERLADRSAWLTTRLIEQMRDEDLKPDSNGLLLVKSFRELGQDLARRLVAPEQPGYWSRLMRFLPLSSKQAKACNIIRELHQLSQSGQISKISVENMHKVALAGRCRTSETILRHGLYSGFFLTSMALSWINLANPINMVTGSGQFACRFVSSVYGSLHALGQIALVPQTATVALLGYENLIKLDCWVRSWGWRKVFDKDKLALHSFFVFGFICSIGFSVSTYGAVLTSLRFDPCLKGANVIRTILPTSAALSGFLHTWSIGPEFLGLLKSFKTLGRDIYQKLPGRPWVRRNGSYIIQSH